MMKLSYQSLKDKSFWEKAGIALPCFDRDSMIAATKQTPKWLHFGAGNIFRAFPAALMQTLLEEGIEDTGIIVAEGYDGEIIGKCFDSFDNLTILVTLKSDGTTEKKVIGSVAGAIRMDLSNKGESGLATLKKVFASVSLQIASFTITEKGYALRNKEGGLFKDIAEDMAEGPGNPKSYLGRITSLLYERYILGAYPVAMVSMDNCSHNGDVLFSSVKTIAENWIKNKKIPLGFLDYILDKNKVSFPWTMIDKITPRPDESIRNMLASCGLEDMHGFITEKNTFTAPFVNAEETQYLIIEDAFPNGRPALEKTGVIFTDKETVDRAEKMKVCTCLNPLHTSLAIFGCLLGYTRISDEMKDPDLVNLIKGVGYEEGLPAVIDPGIINPRDFIDTVINARLPNPFLPDTPQRIAMDSSLKIPIRFGETIKAYLSREKGEGRREKTDKYELDITNLIFIPLVFAGWLRYLLGVDDQGNKFEVSPDPNYETLKNALSGVELGQKQLTSAYIHEKLQQILSNSAYFGVNLYEIGLAHKVETLFLQMLEGVGAVRNVLKGLRV